MTTNHLTDAELMREVYASHSENAVMQDLARRFDDALDELAAIKDAMKLVNATTATELADALSQFMDDNK